MLNELIAGDCPLISLLKMLKETRAVTAPTSRADIDRKGTRRNLLENSLYLNRFVLPGFMHLPEPIKLYTSDLCVLLNLNYITIFKKEKDHRHAHSLIP